MRDKAKHVIDQIFQEDFTLTWEETETIHAGKGTFRPDLHLVLQYHDREFHMVFEIKRSGEPRFISQVAGNLNKYRDRNDFYPVMIAPYVSDRGRDLCQEFGIGFIDLEGNAFLKFDSIMIDRYGKDNRKVKIRRQKKMFTRKASWVYRTMLEHQDRSWTFTELSDGSNVSIAYVHRVIDKLEMEGFIEKRWGSIRLKKPSDLLDEWRDVYHYDENGFEEFYCPIKEQEDIIQALRSVPLDQYALTLGSAATIIAPFVRSSDVHIYCPGSLSNIINSLNLKPVEFGGVVKISDPIDEGILFNTQRIDGISMVSNVQLYLDLYNYPKRGREQAEHLREIVMGV